MNKILLLASAVAWILSFGALNGEAEQFVKPDSPNISYEGVRYLSTEPDGAIRFKRFSDAVLNNGPGAGRKSPIPAAKAQTTPCVKMYFKTANKKMTLIFKTPEPYTHRGASFGIYQNGKWCQSVDFSAKQRDMEFTLESKTPGRPVVYTIALPSWSNPFFYGMQLDDDSPLLPYKPPKRPVYVAIGDSVSHGTGQRSASHLTWPYKLAEKLDYQIYNLAIGGGRIRLDIADMLKDWPHIDLITIYLGINDSGRSTVAEYKRNYDDLLSTIRKHHPNTKIFCITMHAIPEDKIGRASKVPLIAFRKPVIEVVKRRVEAGDKNLYIIHGEKISTLDDAMNPGNVHLSIDGADSWATKLYALIKEMLSNKPNTSNVR